MPEQTSAERLVSQVPQFVIPPDRIQTLGNPPSKPEVTPPAPTPSPALAAKPADAAKPASEAETLPKELLEADKVEGEDTEKETLGKDPESADDPVRKMQRRIDRATRRAAEAQAKAEAAEARLKEFEAKTAPKTPDAAPRMEDFTDIQEYAKAYAEFEKGNAIKDYEEKQQKQRQQEVTDSLTADWSKKAERGEDKYDDFREVVGELKPTTPWAIALMEEDNGDEVAYYLGTHMAEARKIFSMTPLAQAREIGKLSVKLSTVKAAPPKPSKAPAPISPVSGAAAPSEPDLTAAMDPKDYMKLGNKMFRGSR